MESYKNDTDDGHKGRKSRKSAPTRYAPFLARLEKQRGLRCVLKESNVGDSSHTGQISSSKKSKEADLLETSEVGEWDSSASGTKPARESTPVRGSFTSPRRRRRSPSLGGSSELTDDAERSRSFMIPSRMLRNRSFHPKYDPNIEIRQAEQRMEKYNSTDWAVEGELQDELMEDMNKYSHKLRQRKSLRGIAPGDVQMESDLMTLQRRQKDIDIGKNTDEYVEYIQLVPKPNRDSHQPRTPNKFHVVSRRAWDGLVKRWRKHLHYWKDPNFADKWRLEHSVSSVDSSQSESGTPISRKSKRLSRAPPPTVSEDRMDVEDEGTLTEKPVLMGAGVVSPRNLRHRVQEDEGTLPEKPVLMGAGVVSPRNLRHRVVQEDEETLDELKVKSANKSKTWASILTSGPCHVDDDDAAMTGFPDSGPRLTRSRAAGLRSPRKVVGSSGPELDVLHSGLTCELAAISNRTPTKRTSAVLDPAVGQLRRSGAGKLMEPETEDTALMSPLKRVRRSSGRDKNTESGGSRPSLSYANVAASSSKAGPPAARKLDLNRRSHEPRK